MKTFRDYAHDSINEKMKKGPADDLGKKINKLVSDTRRQLIDIDKQEDRDALSKAIKGLEKISKDL